MIVKKLFFSSKAMFALLVLIFVSAMLFIDNDSSSKVEFYPATGTIKIWNSSELKKMIKIKKFLKVQNDSWVSKCSVKF